MSFDICACENGARPTRAHRSDSEDQGKCVRGLTLSDCIVVRLCSRLLYLAILADADLCAGRVEDRAEGTRRGKAESVFALRPNATSSTRRSPRPRMIEAADATPLRVALSAENLDARDTTAALVPSPGRRCDGGSSLQQRFCAGYILVLYRRPTLIRFSFRNAAYMPSPLPHIHHRWVSPASWHSETPGSFTSAPVACDNGQKTAMDRRPPPQVSAHLAPFDIA